MAGPLLAGGYLVKGLLAGQSGGSGQLVGDAYLPYEGPAGGIFYDRRAAELSAREQANLLNAIAARRRRQEKRGLLDPRGPRAAVVGATNTARPNGRGAIT